MSNGTEPTTPLLSTEPTTPTNDTQPGSEPTSLLGGNDTQAGAQDTQAGAEAPAFDLAEVNVDALKALLPEGAELNEELSTEFLGIINTSASRADMAKGLIALQSKIQEQSVTAVQEAWNNTTESWATELKTDATIGGEKLEVNLAKARTVIETYADDPKALKELFALTGLGNNVHMAKLLVKLADAIPGESKPVEGAPTQTTKSRADRLFSTQPS